MAQVSFWPPRANPFAKSESGCAVKHSALFGFRAPATPPMLSPEAFASVELPALQALTSGAATIFGKPIACVMGGDTYPILDSLLATRPGYLICPPETDQKAFLAKLRAHPDIRVRMSMAPQVIAAGNMDAIRREVDRLIALIGDRQNASIGAGVIPYETDPEVVLKTGEYVEAARGPA